MAGRVSRRRRRHGKQYPDWDRDAPKDLHDNFLDTIEPVITSEPKRKVLEDMLDVREARIYLDARRPHVVVPAAHRAEHDLVLRIGYHLVPRIADLAVDDFGVTGSLSFLARQAVPAVRVPWDGHLRQATIDGYARGMEWVADLPDAEAGRRRSNAIRPAAPTTDAGEAPRVREGLPPPHGHRVQQPRIAAREGPRRSR